MEGFTSHQRSNLRKARPQLGRSVQGRLLFKKGELLLRRYERKTFASSLECRTPQEVLSVNELTPNINKF